MSATAVHADIADDGQWYIDGYEIRDFHDQGIDGSGVTIAVIDDGINLAMPELGDADITVHEPSSCYGPDGEARPAESDDLESAWHGTNVTAVLAGSGQGPDGEDGVLGIAPGAKVLFYSRGASDADCYDAEGTALGASDVSSLIRQAVKDGADIISMSIGTPEILSDAIAEAIRAGVILVAALSNQGEGGLEQNDSSPATNNGVLSVSAFGTDGAVISNTFGQLSSHYVDVVGPGDSMLTRGSSDAGWDGLTLSGGTSFATPFVAGNLALGMQKYPEATENQLLQSMIRNTDAEPHELQYDPDMHRGYGSADTISFLAADPSQYEDVNPLLTEDDGSIYWMGPSIAEINGEPGTSPSSSAGQSEGPAPSDSPEPTPADSTESEDGSSVLVPVIIALVAVLVIGAVVVVIVMNRTRKKENSHGNV